MISRSPWNVYFATKRFTNDIFQYAHQSVAVFFFVFSKYVLSIRRMWSFGTVFFFVQHGLSLIHFRCLAYNEGERIQSFILRDVECALFYDAVVKESELHCIRMFPEVWKIDANSCVRRKISNNCWFLNVKSVKSKYRMLVQGITAYSYEMAAMYVFLWRSLVYAAAMLLSPENVYLRFFSSRINNPLSAVKFNNRTSALALIIWCAGDGFYEGCGVGLARYFVFIA